MLSFGVRNLRRLKSVNPISIKKLNILVGRNTSGKSSYLRTFPLIKQSVITKTSRPVLWWGDLVDFGDHSVAATRGIKRKDISFDFKFDNLVRVGNLNSRHINLRSWKNVRYSVTLSEDSGKSYISKIKIVVANKNSTLFNINKNGRVDEVVVGDCDIKRDVELSGLSIDMDTMFPRISIARTRQDEREQYVSNPRMPEIIIRERAYKAIVNIIESGVKIGRLSNYTVRSAIHSYISSMAEKKISFRNIRETGKTWDTVKSYFESNSDADSRVKAIGHFVVAVDIIRSASIELQSVFSTISYMGPARLNNERYYRVQDLSVSELAPDGRNTPMFIRSLSDREQKDFSAWVERLFGFGVQVEATGAGHLTVNVIRGDAESRDKTNVADTGYGVSQILPVLAQIWWNRRMRRDWFGRKAQLRIALMEQPELHLHPAHQALIADALVEGLELSASNRDGEPEAELCFIVETHSDAMLNRIGELIYKGRVLAKDVQVVVFEEDEADEFSTNVRICPFDDDGALIDWPVGFFQPDWVMSDR